VAFQRLEIDYRNVTRCPLCGGMGRERSALRRKHYYFARFEIPLPTDGVSLLECSDCSMLFKSAVPTAEACNQVMSGGATDVWRPKPGRHPALPMMDPYIGDARSFLDIGASNGDLLAQLYEKADRVSAMDVVEYPQCREIVMRNGEYIIGQLEGQLSWSGRPYDVVTAFDVFEHFLDADNAVANLLSFVRPGGYLIVETGDWRTVPVPGDWYYTNLFEHQIFWTRATFDYLAAHFLFSIEEYSQVNHKGRRAMALLKRLALSVITGLAPQPWFRKAMLAAGRDPGHFGAPGLIDHAFVVLKRPHHRSPERLVSARQMDAT
jgi:2-polyprenyl-3-methyl-5-hydroxy-6-metoxy-1,4-benzoquinol methylase